VNDVESEEKCGTGLIERRPPIRIKFTISTSTSTTTTTKAAYALNSSK